MASEEGRAKYPELHRLAEEIAREVCTEINRRVQKVESEMPYKAQYVLEEVAALLEKSV